MSTVNDTTFSEMAFRFRLTASVAFQILAFVLFVGVVRAFIPV